MPVTFLHADSDPKIVERRRLKRFIAHIFQQEGFVPGKVQYVFCSDDYLLDINQRFLGHDFYTDIITFDLRDAVSRAVDAEIYISVDRVRENSKNLGVPFLQEMLRVMFHGPLHLCGYSDKTKREKLMMREKEEHYLRLYHSSTT